MDCDSCGRHWPSDQVVAARSSSGAVVMVCGRCRRHMAHRPAAMRQPRPTPATPHASAVAA